MEVTGSKKKEESKLSGVQTLKQLFIEIWKTLVVIGKWFMHLNQKWNEAWLLVLGIVAWKYADVVLGYVDPTVPPLPVNDLMRFLYATVGTCIVHFVVSLMLRLSHPLIFKYLYGYFYSDLYAKSADLKSHSINHDLKCARLKYSLLVWLSYVATWLVVLATY